MLVKTIKKKNKNYKPIWFMRQAGRHLPNYQKLRKKHNTFLNFCLTTSSIVEATLIPIKEYDLDAVILFSDILILPWTLGQKVSFIKNIGPQLSNIDYKTIALKSDVNLIDVLEPIGTAIKQVKSKIPISKDLIGFAGAPWTIACYMIEGGTSKNFEKIREILWNDERGFLEFYDRLTNKVIDLLEYQVKCGVDVLMIFDTWSHMIPSVYWQKLGIVSMATIVEELRRRGVLVPIIGFPFKAGEKLVQYSYESKVDVVSVDWSMDLKWVLNNINKHVVTQGNLDPIALTTENTQSLTKAVTEILDITKDKVHIFNVGHGLTPKTQIENVKKTITLVRTGTQ